MDKRVAAEFKPDVGPPSVGPPSVGTVGTVGCLRVLNVGADDGELVVGADVKVGAVVGLGVVSPH